MTAEVAMVLDALRRHGVAAYRLDAEHVRLIPKAAVSPELLALIVQAKPALLPLLPPLPPPRGHRDSCDETCDDAGDGTIGCNPPDPTPLPPPCAACGSLIHWRPFGSDRVQCEGCEPCPHPCGAAWYGEAASDDPLGELLDPDA